VSDYSMSSGWFPVSTAPRDGTPVVLWMVEDEMPPALPLIGGYWTVNTATGLGGWRIFGAAETSRFEWTSRSKDGSPCWGIRTIAQSCTLLLNPSSKAAILIEPDVPKAQGISAPDPKLTLMVVAPGIEVPYPGLEHAQCDDASRKQKFETCASAHSLSQFPVRDRTPR
jgi:hypothetical protein